VFAARRGTAQSIWSREGDRVRVWMWGELFWPYIGGAELFAADLMLGLRERGYEFTVVTSQDHLDLPDRAEYRGIPVYRFPFRTALRREHVDDLGRMRERVAALKRELHPDLIHLNGVTPSAFFCVHTGSGSRPPLVIRLNQETRLGRPGRIAGSLFENVLRRGDWVIAVSEALLAEARQLVPDVTPYSSVIYNGIDVGGETPGPPPGDPPRILCLGRLVFEKGFDRALEAFATLRPPRRARLIIAGDGPQRAALQEQATALGLGADVEFTGWIAPDAVPALLASAAVVAVPSRREGLPSVALQAAAAGRPVVAARAGGLPEIVRDGETGVLVDDDPAALARALSRLCTQPETARRMGLAAWRRARQLFTREQCLDAYDALYRRVAARRAL
jgi:glycogen(starch) synthase